MSSEDVIRSLLEMGFTKSRAEKALDVTGHQGVEPAMEWLLAHADDEILPPAQPAPMPTLNLNTARPSVGLQPTADTSDGNGDSKITDTGEGSAIVAADTDTATVPEAKSLKCDECGKLFKNQLDVEFHAAKSGHSSFSESTQEKKPLTEEEKREQLRKLEEKMKLKRLEREQAEREEAFEREKHRIKTSKEISAAKKKLEDAEMKKLIEQRKREKLDEKLARQRVKDQIEQDKIARRAKYGASLGPTLETEAAAAPTSPPATKPLVHPPVNYSQTKLQIRLTNGQVLTQTFGSKEELSAVRLYISINRTDPPGPFSLMTSFPKKVFTETDFSKPLDMLGLVPSAVVIVSRVAPVSMPSVDPMDGMLD